MKFISLILAIFTPLPFMILLLFVGAGLIVFGISLLAGIAWAYISAGIFLLAFSVLIAKGLKLSG